MNKKEALEKLKELSNNLENVDYLEIENIFKLYIKLIPIPTTILKKGSKIDRVRKNTRDILFTNVEEVSYIKNPEIIKNITEFGRANKPNQIMFYGSIESTELKQQRLVAIAETSELFQNPNGVNLEGELYTVSRWSTSEDLLIAQVVFSKEAIKINPDVKKAFEHQNQLALKELNHADYIFYLDFLVFISEQFARTKNTHHDYKISAVYSNLILTHPEIKGIFFPSVQTKLMGLNIVFEPKIVDKYLDIEVVATQKLYKNCKQTFIGRDRNCLNPKECYNNLIWSEQENNGVTNEDIIKFLNE